MYNEAGVQVLKKKRKKECGEERQREKKREDKREKRKREETEGRKGRDSTHVYGKFLIRE